MCQVRDALEYFSAPDLEQRCRRSRVYAARHLRNDAQFGCLKREHIELDACDLPDELPERRVVLTDFGSYDLLETREITCRPTDPGHARTLVAEQEFGVGPALVFLADQILCGNAHVLEEDVVHLVGSINGDDGPHRDAGRFHVDQQEGDAGLRLCRRVGPHQAEDPVGMLGQCRPGFVSVNNIVIAVPHGFGADRREVGAGSRLRIALAPPILTGEDSRQKFLFLRVVAERVDNRTDHGHAEREWRQRPGT